MRDIPDQPEPPTSEQIINQLSTLGVNSAQQGYAEVSRAAMLRALCEDRRPDVVANAANSSRLCWRFEEAEKLMAEALAKAPNDGRFWATQGLLLMDTGRPAEAVEAFDKSLKFGAPTALNKMGRAMSLLASGRIQEGIAGYEARFELNRPLPHAMPRWRGEPLRDKVLLVEAEQGLGDSLMFSRFLDRLEGNYVFSVQPQLQPFFPHARRLGEEVRADYWIPLMSLPMLVGPDLSYRPLQPRRLMPLITDSLVNIGIFWKAKAANATIGPQEERHGRQKSLPLEMLFDLATLPDVRLHSLQVGESAQPSWGIVNEPPIYDFCDLASYMAQCDLIIGVDTAPIHLAGMMNRPTLLMLNYTGSWQWGTGDFTPWYRTIRILRQQIPGEWRSVIDEAKEFVLRQVPQQETACPPLTP